MLHFTVSWYANRVKVTLAHSIAHEIELDVLKYISDTQKACSVAEVKLTKTKMPRMI